MCKRKSPRAGETLRIGCIFQDFVYACSAIIMISSILVAVELSIPMAWSGAAHGVQAVQRAGKGDRLQQLPRSNRRGLNELDEHFIEGCESLASSLTHNRFVFIAARCLS
jgi:hypothetical protein